MVVVLGSQYYKVRWLRDVIQISLSGMVMGKKMLSSVQSLSRVQRFATPWTAACQVSLSITNSRLLLKLMSIDVSQWCHPTISSSSIFFINNLHGYTLLRSPSTSLFPRASLLFLLVHSTGFLLLLLFFKSVFFFNLKILPNFFFFFFCYAYGLWDLSSLTRDQTGVSCNGSAES